MLQAEARAAADQTASSAKLRHAGNKAFQRGRVEEAVRLYSEVRLSITVTRYVCGAVTPPLCCLISTQHFLGMHGMVCLLLGWYVPAPMQGLRNCHAHCT